MTGADHEHSEMVTEAARWLSEQSLPPSPIVPTLRQRFGLTCAEAAEAASLAHSFRTTRKVNG